MTTIFPRELVGAATEFLSLLKGRDIVVTTAESCTGGLISALLTDISGSSACFVQGIVSYANEAKMSLLGVDEGMLRRYGAVSEAVARAMAEGALERVSSAVPPYEQLLAGKTGCLSIAVTGIAGPTGGSKEKPVGTVHIATAYRGLSSGDGDDDMLLRHVCKLFSGDRAEVRIETVREAIQLAKTHIVHNIL